jgi:hypothetical protein
MHSELGIPLWVVSTICVGGLIGLFVSIGQLSWRAEPRHVSVRQSVQLVVLELITIGVAAAYGFSGTRWGTDLFGTADQFERSLAITVTASYTIVIYVSFGLLALVSFAGRVELPPKDMAPHLSPVGVAPAAAFVIAALLGEISSRRDLSVEPEVFGWAVVVVLLFGHGVAVVVMYTQCRRLVGQRDHIATETPLMVAICVSMLAGLWVFTSG